MHNGVVHRIQVYLEKEELEFLDQAAQATGASRSALIRRAVRETFGTTTKADKTRALRASTGSWKGRSFTGAEYVDAMRGDPRRAGASQGRSMAQTAWRADCG
jgi:Arc/MetJ-type ribon-helix-helix transcriptional regulator